MIPFDNVIAVDWSGGSDTGPHPRADAIWIARSMPGGEAEPEAEYLRNRLAAEDRLADLLTQDRAASRRVLVGVDFPLGYPAGFARALTGRAEPLALWDWMEARIEDGPAGSNRFDLAGAINAAFPGIGPFWGNGLKRDIAHLPRKGRARAGHGLAERRAAERRLPGTFSCWQLSGAGAVGSQALTGLPVLARLRRRFAAAVWPFEPVAGAGVVIGEIWPGLIDQAVRAATGPDDIRDAVQVRLMARALSRLAPDRLAAMMEDLPPEAAEEGWILGIGHEAALIAAAAPARLADDCFALPPGVDWTPVDAALDRLRTAVAPVTGIEHAAIAEAAGRILAEPAVALRANPPAANAAVDGHAFAFADAAPAAELPLAPGRAAAGAPFAAPLPPGHALRILTGAEIPEGGDTVVMDEDCTLARGRIAFARPRKPGANVRPAGEDCAAGEEILPAGRCLNPADLARLAAAGVARVALRRPLRVAVLSTGDELLQPGADPAAPGIFDANRPMLAALAAAQGFAVVDLGAAPDRAASVRAALDRGAAEADAILTSGGASAGDEDHVSRLIAEEGRLATWRIAVKPGRPLALGTWAGVPVFGLPGNPVAAFVCFLIFARPALRVMAGADWHMPQGYLLPAAFTKSKRAGRREFLRARPTGDGRVEVFHSEGSGLIGGLSWAEGLVDLPEAAAEIAPGDPVRYLPFAEFGI